MSYPATVVNQSLSVPGASMNPGSNPGQMPAGISVTSPAVPLQSPSGGHAYSPHVANPPSHSPAAPGSVEGVHGATGVIYPGQQTHALQQATSTAVAHHPQAHNISDQMAEKIRQQILKFTQNVSRSLPSIENNATLWTPVIQEVIKCGKGGLARVGQLSNAELELFSKEIKMFTQKYTKYKAP